jgi:hypothetical protein
VIELDSPPRPSAVSRAPLHKPPTDVRINLRPGRLGAVFSIDGAECGTAVMEPDGGGITVDLMEPVETRRECFRVEFVGKMRRHAWPQRVRISGDDKGRWKVGAWVGRRRRCKLPVTAPALAPAPAPATTPASAPTQGQRGPIGSQEFAAPLAPAMRPGSLALIKLDGRPSPDPFSNSPLSSPPSDDFENIFSDSMWPNDFTNYPTLMSPELTPVSSEISDAVKVELFFADLHRTQSAGAAAVEE